MARASRSEGSLVIVVYNDSDLFSKLRASMKRIQSIFGAILVLILVVSVGYNHAQAEENYYHIFVANWGSDSNAGTDTAPLRSLREAFSRVTPDQPNRINVLGSEFVLDSLLEDPTGNNHPLYQVMEGYQVSVSTPSSAIPPIGNNATKVQLLSDPDYVSTNLSFYSRNGRLFLENIEFSHLHLRLQPSQGGTVSLRNIRSYADSADNGSPVILANSNSGSLVIEDSEIGYAQSPFASCDDPNSNELWYRLIFYNKGSENGSDLLSLQNNTFSVPTSLNCYFRVVDTAASYPDTWIQALGNTFQSTGVHLHDESIGFYIPNATPWNDLVVDNDFTDFWGEPVVD